eukprot:gene3698-4607_t
MSTLVLIPNNELQSTPVTIEPKPVQPNYESEANTVRALQSGTLTIRTSTDYNADHDGTHALLNFTKPYPQSTQSEAWCASILDTNQYILLGGDVPKTFVCLATQGRGDTDQWVSSYRVSYTLDNLVWYEYENGKVFPGNFDKNTPVTLFFDPPIVARSVSIRPNTWHNHISMRLEHTEVPIKVQTGTVQIGDRSLNSREPSGLKMAERQVTFPRSFKTVPNVSLTIRLLDSNADNRQTRIMVEPKNVTEKGFICVFKTWVKSTVYECQVDYLAVEGSIVQPPPPQIQSRFFLPIPIPIPLPIIVRPPAPPAPTVTTNIHLSNITNFGTISVNVGR